MAVVTNLWPDPKFQTANGTGVLAYNYFPNPSPTGALTGFAAEGSSTVTQDSAVSIKGDGGMTVVSSNGTSGIKISAPGAGVDWLNVNFTVYVRAHAAMTITGSAAADYLIDTGSTVVGWGDYGWGETYSYEAGAAYTFEAGEVKRFRINVVLDGGDYTSGEIGWAFKLLGSGTFDVDAVWYGAGIAQGMDPSEYPGGVVSIPNAPLYFDGNTPDANGFTYAWAGAANASTSSKVGQAPKYAVSRWTSDDASHDNAYLTELAGGEKAAAFQSRWALNNTDSLELTDAAGLKDLKTLGLTVGHKYVLSLDVVSLHENYLDGYPGGLWDDLWLDITSGAGYGIPLPHPTRQRIHVPIIVGAGTVKAAVTNYRNRMTGAIAVTSVSLVEVDFAAPEWYNSTGAAADRDLLAQGLVAGGSYTANYEGGLATGKYYRIEYQTAAGGGTWTTLSEILYDAGYVSDAYTDSFTVPETATALRLVTAASQFFRFNVFSTPPEFFSGDTPDGGGYTYAWTGTPGDSTSTRTEAAGLQGQVFIDGTGVPIAEMAIVIAGELVNITQIGN